MCTNKKQFSNLDNKFLLDAMFFLLQKFKPIDNLLNSIKPSFPEFNHLDT